MNIRISIASAALCALASSVSSAADTQSPTPVAAAAAAQAAEQSAQQNAQQARTQAEREHVQKRLQEAQDQLERSAQKVAELSLSLNDLSLNGVDIGEIQFHTRNAGPRAMLGINFAALESGTLDGGKGVRVVSVSPGGPAELAGVKANDILMSFNGKPLQSTADQQPQQQLLSLMRDVKVGETVTLEYQRNGKLQKAQVVTRNAPAVFAGAQLLNMPNPMPPEDLKGLSDGRWFSLQKSGFSGLGSAELVELSPALGKYFGTDRGLLVVRAPKDERFKLQDGDVLLDIDGRVPNSVAHAFQILSSYGAGEKLKLHIMRQQKRSELQVEVPAAVLNRPTALLNPPTPPLPDLPLLTPED